MPKRTLRSVRGGQPYTEAFPALDVLAVERAVAAGRGVCQWTNERGVVVGQLVIEQLDSDSLVVLNNFLGAVNVGYRYGIDRFSIRRKRHNANHNRPTIVCPTCGRSTRFVYNVAGHWSCRLCHDLTGLPRRLGAVTRYQRRLQELKALLSRGRPRYGRKAAFEALRQEYGELVRSHGDLPPLPVELSFAQYAEWMTVGDPRIKRQAEPGEEEYGWTRFDEGGFRRLGWIAEQEVKTHDEAELMSRGRPSSDAVRPLWKTGPTVEQKPYAASPAASASPSLPARVDFSLYEEDQDLANDGF